MSTSSIEIVDAIESTFHPAAWTFAQDEAARIAAHWESLRAGKPQLFDGRVLLVDRWDIEERGERRVLTTRHFATNYSAFLAWRDFGFPDMSVRNCFAAAALVSADGDFVLGRMGAHTANAGQIYFPCGTPDMDDVHGDAVDLAGSVLRELEEETGLAPHDVACDPQWSLVLEGPRLGCLRAVRSPLPTSSLVARIEAFLRADANPELGGVHIARGEADLTPDMPGFITAYLRAAFSRREA